MLIGLGQDVSAQTTSGIEQKGVRTVKLQWKLAEGETLFYEQFEEKQLRVDVGNQPFEFKDRRYYLYRWDVLFDQGPLSPEGVPFSLAMVNFGWIQHESTTPERSIFVDTYAPSGTAGLGFEEKQMQDEVFGMLRSSFVFFFAPDGGTMLPSDAEGMEIPQQMRVPDTIQSPRSFTPGDMVGFPKHRVSIGDSWTVPVHFENLTGIGRYRLVEESQLNGHKCWVIEGETSYNMPELENQADIASSSLGPRISRYCFDAERGRLLKGEEVIPIKVTLVDGQTRSTTVRVTRELIEQPKEPLPVNVTRKIAGGEVLQLPYRGGLPMNATGQWADVASAGLSVRVGEQDGRVKPEKLVWSIVLKPKLQHSVANITVEDVTFEDPVVMLRLDDPEPENGRLLLLLNEVDITQALPEWLERDEITERIFRIVLRNPDGDSSVMYQTVQIRAGQLRDQINQVRQQ